MLLLCICNLFLPPHCFPLCCRVKRFAPVCNFQLLFFGRFCGSLHSSAFPFTLFTFLDLFLLFVFTFSSRRVHPWFTLAPAFTTKSHTSHHSPSLVLLFFFSLNSRKWYWSVRNGYFSWRKERGPKGRQSKHCCRRWGMAVGQICHVCDRVRCDRQVVCHICDTAGRGGQTFVASATHTWTHGFAAVLVGRNGPSDFILP